MTIELVTGHAGSAHVSSADVGWFNAGTIGDGKYVLKTGTQFECEVQNANLVTVGTGDAVFEGRHVRISATENVAIDNGSQGMYRNDIICIKYTYTPTSESASLVVVKGTPASSNPSDPTIPSGSILADATEAYMPLWRIKVNGITLDNPEPLYSTINGTVAISALINNIHLSRLASWTGATQKQVSLPSSSEFLIMCEAGGYIFTATIHGSLLSNSTKKLVLGGNYNSYAVLNISASSAKASDVVVNGSTAIDTATWTIWVR